MEPTKLEIWGLKLLLARLKSKSPQKYALAVKWCVMIASIATAYVGMYNMGLPHSSLDHVLGVIDNICILITATSIGVGFTAATNTSDPRLIDPAVKTKVIQEAVDNGTHAPVSAVDRGNNNN